MSFDQLRIVAPNVYSAGSADNRKALSRVEIIDILEEINVKTMIVRLTTAALARFLLLLVCACRAFAQSNGPLDSLREQFLAKARQRSAFQPIVTNLTGRVVSVDDSRRILYQSLPQQAAASSVLGKYVESVTIDDGHSRAKAVCSVFERDAQPRVTPGELTSVSGTFIGAILPGAVELIKCSFTGGQPARATAAPAPGGPGISGGQAQASRNQAQTRAAELLRAITVAQPGSGVHPAQISALLYEGYGTSTVFGFQYVENVYLVLADGWACSNPEVPPSELNVEASRRLEPEKWRRWQKAGSKYRFQNSKTGAWQDVAAHPVEPLAARLNSRLKTMKAYSFGGMGASVFSRTIAFTPDGRYERSTGVLQGSGAVQAASGFNAGAASVQDKYGRRSSAGGGNGSVAVASSSRSAAGGGGMSGSYSVSGYTLELRGDDGSVQRILAFYPFAKEDKSRIFLGDATFNSQ